jgi:hypothetical protein
MDQHVTLRSCLSLPRLALLLWVAALALTPWQDVEGQRDLRQHHRPDGTPPPLPARAGGLVGLQSRNRSAIDIYNARQQVEMAKRCYQSFKSQRSHQPEVDSDAGTDAVPTVNQVRLSSLRSPTLAVPPPGTPCLYQHHQHPATAAPPRRPGIHTQRHRRGVHLGEWVGSDEDGAAQALHRMLQ